MPMQIMLPSISAVCMAVHSCPGEGQGVGATRVTSASAFILLLPGGSFILAYMDLSFAVAGTFFGVMMGNTTTEEWQQALGEGVPSCPAALVWEWHW